MTRSNLPIRIALVLAAAIAVLAVLRQFSAQDEDFAQTGGMPVVAAKVEWPKLVEIRGDPLLTPPRRAPQLAAPIAIEGHIDPLDATAFRTMQTVIRLRHLIGPARDAVCVGEDGLLWGCGLQARVALVNALRSDRARCLPALDTPGEKDRFQCWVGEQDLSRMMIRGGWARPMSWQAATYSVELDAAMAEKAGLWRGRWTTSDGIAQSSIDSPAGRISVQNAGSDKAGP